jgi:uncharacterized protein YqhQ
VEKKIMVGGQAVMEGVLMRSQESYAVAVRRPNGGIVVKKAPWQTITKKYKLAGLPILRGSIILIEALILGINALTFSGDIAMEDGKDKKGKEPAKSIWGKIGMVLMLIFSFALGLALFFYVPLLITDLFNFASGFAFNIMDGLIRLLFFLAYIYLISLWKEIHRIFEYHGAEHKSVFAFEEKKELTVNAARPYSTHHPRCGTSFLLIVMLTSILVFMFLGKPDGIGDRLLRLAFVPLIGGIAYEFIRLSERASKNPLTRFFVWPGLWLQKITTKEPDDSQIEVALVALRCALDLDPHVGESQIEILTKPA